MYKKNTRIARKLEHKPHPVVVRFRGPRMGPSKIRTAVGATAMIGGILRLLSCRSVASSRAESEHIIASQVDAKRREGSP